MTGDKCPRCIIGRLAEIEDRDTGEHAWQCDYCWLVWRNCDVPGPRFTDDDVNALLDEAAHAES